MFDITDCVKAGDILLGIRIETVGYGTFRDHDYPGCYSTKTYKEDGSTLGDPDDVTPSAWPFECGRKRPFGDAAKQNCPRYPAMDEFKQWERTSRNVKS